MPKKAAKNKNEKTIVVHEALPDGYATGRPPRFKTPEEMEVMIKDYFDTILKDNEILMEQYKSDIQNLAEIGVKNPKLPLPNFRRPLVTGLANHLGMTRQNLIDYQKKGPFLDTIKKAKQAIEEYAENMLYTGQNPTGVIFSLKNNFKWKDKTEVDNNVSLKSASDLIDSVDGGDDDDYGYLDKQDNNDDDEKQIAESEVENQ